MKPFNIEEYLKNPSKQLVTRDGRNARVVCTDKKGRYPVAALVEDYDGTSENVFAFTKDGRYYGGEPNEKDLFFVAPETHEGWARICFNNGEYYLDNIIYPSKADAKNHADKFVNTVTAVKIEWEE